MVLTCAFGVSCLKRVMTGAYRALITHWRSLMDSVVVPPAVWWWWEWLPCSWSPSWAWRGSTWCWWVGGGPPTNRWRASSVAATTPSPAGAAGTAASSCAAPSTPGQHASSFLQHFPPLCCLVQWSGFSVWGCLVGCVLDSSYLCYPILRQVYIVSRHCCWVLVISWSCFRQLFCWTLPCVRNILGGCQHFSLDCIIHILILHISPPEFLIIPFFLDLFTHDAVIQVLWHSTMWSLLSGTWALAYLYCSFVMSFCCDSQSWCFVG